MSAGSTSRCIFVTGTPGIGKTTLIKNVVQCLKREQISFHGFYTEELRQQGVRVGFDAVSIALGEENSERAALARLDDNSTKTTTRPFKVGKYVVDICSFDKLMHKSLQHSAASSETPAVVIIDEIGKMELFSQQFQTAVHSIVTNPNYIVLATIPSKPNRYVDHLRSKYHPKLFTVTHNNRDRLCQEIMLAIKQFKI